MNSRPRRHRLVAIVVVLAAIGGARLAWRPPAPPARAAADPTGSPAWELGQLRLQPCVLGKANSNASADGWCTRFEVPEDRARPEGRRIGLRVAVVRSAAEKPAADWVVFLDGGPGGAATADYAQLRGAFAEMLRRRHLLLIDQRGTGDSNPLRCDESGDAAAPQRDQVVVDQSNRVDAGRLQQGVRRCLERLRTRADPAMYTTGAAVADLEAVRLALGAPQLNLVGVSYGTRVAQQYAATYPGAVRSMVLDSAVPNALALGSEHARNLEASLSAQFARCAADSACRQRFGDPYEAIHALRRQLRARPMPTSARDPMTHAPFERDFGAADLAATARLFAYSPLTAALLPLGVDEALKGNAAPLLAQEKLIVDVLDESLTDGVGLSVACAEDADRLQPQPEDEETLLGNSLVDHVRTACGIWPRGARRPGFNAPLASAAPTLVLAGEFDPVTPVRYGAEVVRHLRQARLLTLKGQGHAVLGVGCVPRLLGQFVDDPQPARLDASCLDALGYQPAFLGYSGAGP